MNGRFKYRISSHGLWAWKLMMFLLSLHICIDLFTPSYFDQLESESTEIYQECGSDQEETDDEAISDDFISWQSETCQSMSFMRIAHAEMTEACLKAQLNIFSPPPELT